MSEQDRRRAELQSLVGQLVDGQLSDADRTRLDDWLRADAEARADYLRYITVHARLHLKHAVQSDPLAVPAKQATTPVVELDERLPIWQSHPVQFGLGVAAMTLFGWYLLFSFIGVWRREGHMADAPGGPTPQPVVAQLIADDDCQWADGGAPLVGHYLLRNTPLDLRSGLAQIEFKSGARVLLQGPVVFRPVSENGGELLAGRLTARVPEQAHGFAVRSEQTRVVDLGTEFGMYVDGLDRTEVIVLEGSVQATPQAGGEPTGKPVTLAAGEGLVFRTNRHDRIEAASVAKNYVRRTLPVPGDGFGVIADYRRNFRPSLPGGTTPAPQWRYLWNKDGKIGNPDHYADLLWNGQGAYTTAGAKAEIKPAVKFLQLNSQGGHPGQSAAQNQARDYFAIAAFRIRHAGEYAIVDSHLSRSGSTGDDAIEVLVHVDAAEPVLRGVAGSAAPTSFDVALGALEPGQTIYVAIGPQESAGMDRFEFDFSLERKPLNSAADAHSQFEN
jgi:hypothetical protein